MAAAATSLLSLYSTTAFADAGADGAADGSPGVLSGNTVQAPVDVPVNVCGNSANVVGLLNPAFGNSCANTSGTAGVPQAAAAGGTSNSPGVISGNEVQVPVNVPVNACGNSVDVVGAANPVSGNACGTGGGGTASVPVDVPQSASTPPARTPVVTPTSPGVPSTPDVPRTSGTSQPSQPATMPAPRPSHTPQTVAVENPSTPGARDTLAETGSKELLAASSAGAALMVGGVFLYRRGRAMGHR
ncbi:chaplin family protein [Streptomyces sp. NPDC020801]|uniref:chaplin family protein n=1 Tax=unclassified Streptomyces TaxID=2593676 RepID=UPI0037BAE580